MQPAHTRKLYSTYALDCLTIMAKLNSFRAFRAWIWHVFGADIPVDAVRKLHRGLKKRRFQATLGFNQAAEPFKNPEIWVEADISVAAYTPGPHSAYAAYTAETIYVSAELVNEARAKEERALLLMAALTEEFGHHIDFVLRNRYSEVRGDARFDEGAIFAMMLRPVDDTRILGFNFAYEESGAPFALRDVALGRAQWGTFFPEYRIQEDRQERPASGAAIEYFGAFDTKIADGKVHSIGHEGIERAVLAKFNWLEDRRKYIYFGNWQRDYSQFGDPKVLGALRIAANLATVADTMYEDAKKELKKIPVISQSVLVLEGASDIAELLIGKICKDQSAQESRLADWKHSAQKEPSAWLVPALVGLLAEKRFTSGVPVFDSDESPYNLGVYHPREHIDNPATIDKSYQHLDARFRPKFEAGEGNVYLDPASNRHGLRNYIIASMVYATEQLLLARKVDRGYRSLSAEQIQCMLMGNALHTVEDYFAHSNFCEIYLRQLGHAVDVYVDPVDDAPPRVPFYPIVTGTFGGLDTAASILAEIAAHLEEAGKRVINGPSTINEMILILLRRVCGPAANFYSLYLYAAEFVQLPTAVKEILTKAFKKFLAYLRKELVWAVVEMFLDMIIPVYIRTVSDTPQPDAQKRAEQAVDARDVDRIVDTFLEIGGLHAVDRGPFRVAAALVDIDHRGDLKPGLRDPLSVAEVFEELVGLYQRLATRDSNEPSHTQMAKDHETQPIHLLAAELAKWADTKLVRAMSLAWDHGKVEEAEEALLDALDRIFRHPARYDPQDAREVETIIKTWMTNNPSAVERLTRKEEARPLDVKNMEERAMFVRNIVNNLSVLLGWLKEKVK